MIPYLVLAFELTLVLKCVRPGRTCEKTLVVLGMIAASKFVGFRMLGGNSFNPELPLWLLIGWGWLESVIWLALPVSVVALVMVWCWRTASAFAGWKTRAPVKAAPRVMWAVIVVSAALAGYGMWEGMRVPPVVERVVELDDLPREFDGYRLVHLSDLHCSSAALRDKIAAIVERVNAARPDLVAITGDFVDGFPEEREHDLEPLEDLQATDGVLACTGNHEKYWRIARWAPFYDRWNVRMLRNSWTTIRRGAAAVVIGGLDDLALAELPEDLFEGAAADSFRILLFHRPTLCEFFDREWKVRLQLAGHTHGGAMPLIDRFVAAHNGGHCRGLYREGRLVLHNSPGTGQWAGFPLRLFNPPEITVLILRRS